MLALPLNDTPPIVLAVARVVAVVASPTAMLALPSNEVPPIVLAVASAVAVSALPVTLPLIFPVVVRLSLPKLMVPELSVIEPAANARVPALNVVPVKVVIVADVCVPATTPVIVGAVKVTDVAVALIPLVKDDSSPIRV